MNKKQKKMLLRIIAAVALCLLSLIPALEGTPEKLLFFACYLVIGYDIAVEMYVLTSRAVAFFLIIEVRTDEDGLVSLEPYADSGYYMVNQLTAYSEVCPDYTKNGEQHMYGHNGIREYYMLTKAQAAQNEQALKDATGE